MRGVVVAVALAAAVTGPVVALWWTLARRRAFGTVAEQAVYEVLHLANEAAPPFRSGLTVAAASRAVRSLRRLLGSEALAITDRGVVLAWDGGGEHHRSAVLAMAGRSTRENVQKALAALARRARPDSDIDLVVVVSAEEFARRTAAQEVEVVRELPHLYAGG